MHGAGVLQPSCFSCMCMFLELIGLFGSIRRRVAWSYFWMGWVVQLWPRMAVQDIGRAKKHRNVSTIGEDGIFVLCTCAHVHKVFWLTNNCYMPSIRTNLVQQKTEMFILDQPILPSWG